jgi:hypothetical protein
MKTLITLIISSLFSLAWAQTPDFGLQNPEFAYVYQQDHFMPKDTLGDVLLAQSLRATPMGLIHVMLGKREQYYSAPYIKAYKLAEQFPKLSRINGADAIYLEKMPVARNFYVLNEENIKRDFYYALKNRKMTAGTIPNWSNEFLQKYQADILPGIKISKLLACLTRGVCARFMLTGQEKRLTAWALSQKNQSISPASLLAKALDLTQNNLAMALLTAQNTLSWHSKAEHRHMTILQSKLRPFQIISGEKSLDKFGEWYHLFGILTYAYAKGQERAENITTLETLGGRILGHPEAVEEEVNAIAPGIGGWLRSKL